MWVSRVSESEECWVTRVYESVGFIAVFFNDIIRDHNRTIKSCVVSTHSGLTITRCNYGNILSQLSCNSIYQREQVRKTFITNYVLIVKVF